MEDLPREADVVFAGAGHNALVAAAYLLAGGRSACLLDQMSLPGGYGGNSGRALARALTAAAGR